MPRRRDARPHCEPLEARDVFSATPMPWAPAPEPAVVRQALAQALSLAPAPARPLARAVEADLDGDGRLDQVRLHRAESGPLELHITRSGGAVAPAILTLPEAGEGLLLADLDGDSHLDLFIPGAGPGQGALLLGRGDGTFAVSRHLATQLALAVADLDGDGLDDFVRVDPAAGRVLAELTTRGREVIADVAAGPLTFGPAVLADLNGDAVLDLAVCDTAAGRLLIYPGLGAGRFGAELHGGGGLAVAPGLSHVAAGRLREAGPFDDLVVVSEMTGKLSVVSGGTGFALLLGPAFEVGVAPSAVLVHDVTGNGRADLVVTSRSADRAWVVPGLGEGGFALAAIRALVTGPRPAGAVAGDFDGDGRCDLVTLDSGGSSLSFYSDVAAEGSTRRVVSAGVSRPSAGIVRDVNGDGMSDLFVGAEAGGELALLLGSSAGPTLSQTQTMPSSGSLALAGSWVSPDSLGVYALTEGSDAVAWVGFEAEPAGGAPTPTDTEGPGGYPTGEAALGAAVEWRPLGPALFGLVPTLVTAGTDWGTERVGGRGEPDLSGVIDEGGCRLVSAPPSDEATANDSPGHRPKEASAVERYLVGVDDVPPPALTLEGVTETPGPAVGAPPPPGEVVAPAEVPPEVLPAAAERPSLEDRRCVEDELLGSALLALALARQVGLRRRGQPGPG